MPPPCRASEPEEHRCLAGHNHLIRISTRRVRYLTVDNGTELHGYKAIEDATGADFYLAAPHCAWERGTNENTNARIGQYPPVSASYPTLPLRCCRISNLMSQSSGPSRAPRRLGVLRAPHGVL